MSTTAMWLLLTVVAILVLFVSVLYKKKFSVQEVTIIAAANGFASVVELKEKLWDSGLNCIVVRGRKGGAPVAIAITNALLNEAAERKKGTQE